MIGMKVMKRTGLIIVSACVAALLATPPAVRAQGTAPAAQISEKAAKTPASNKVLATVGKEKITEETLFAPLAMMPPQFRARYETPEGKKKLFERAVQMSLLAQEARSLNIDKKEEIAQRIKDMIDQLIVQELTKKEVLDKVTVTDADMLQHYNQNKDIFAKREKVRVNFMLFEAKDNSTQPIKDAKKKSAEKALKRIKQGESFESVAAQVSEDSRTKSRGGSLSLFARGDHTQVYGEAFEQKAFSLPVDAVSDVFQSKNGYYIIKVMEKKPQEQEKFEDVKTRIERTLKTEKQKTAMESYIEGLKKKYTVETLDESLK
jgi:peptidyl-prolyl cis-trans isomerase C